MHYSARKETQQLGTMTADVKLLDKRYEGERKDAETQAVKLREEMEARGETDRYERMQPKQRPQIDDSFLGAKIEQLWIYTEKNEKKVHQWCQGEVVAVKKGNRVHVEWKKKYLRRGDKPVTEERFLVSKWNKHVEEGWRMDPEHLI